MASLKVHINKLWKLKQDIEVLEKKLKDLKAKKADEEDKVLNQFDKDELKSVKGTQATLTRVETKVPEVEDWDKFYRYVLRNKAVDILQRRVSTAAYRERIEAGKKVPGLKSFTKISLRLTKNKG